MDVVFLLPIAVTIRADPSPFAAIEATLRSLDRAGN